MTDQKRALLTQAIDTYGANNQIMKALEELGELVQAIAKAHLTHNDKRKSVGVDHVAEEIADVKITLEQLCMIWGIEERVGQWEYSKLARLKERVDMLNDTRPMMGDFDGRVEGV